MDYPLFPAERFTQRMYSWNSIFLGGTDRSMDITTLFWTGVQVLPSISGMKQIGEILVFIFWFTLIGLSMYYLTRKIFPEKPIFQLVSSLFYMINFYQFYNWEIARIGEISGMVLIPLFLGVFIGGLEKKINFAKYAFSICIFSIIGMGIGVQPPTLIILFTTIFSFFIFYIAYSYYFEKQMGLLHKSFLLFSLIVLFILMNMFWIPSVGNFALSSGYASTSNALDVFTVTDYLLDWTSKNTSFLNLLRMLPRVIWFDSWEGQPYFPSLIGLNTNPIMIFIGMLFPILAFTSILISKNRFVIFFTLLTIISIFLAKGLHEPFGDVYRWMIMNIPGFWIYRAPWEKFGLLQALGYSILIGFTSNHIYASLHKLSFVKEKKFKKISAKIIKKAIPIIFILMIITLNMFYNYPLIKGQMIPSSEGDIGYHEKFNVGFYQKFPDYIFNAREWINSQDEEFRVFLLPDDRRNVYNWGYAAAKDITIDLFNKGILLRQYGEGTAPPTPSDEMYHLTATMLYRNSTLNIAKIFGVLNVRYVLQRNDFRYNFYGDFDSPEFVKEQIAKQKGIFLDKTIGEWDFYRVSDEYFIPLFYASSHPVLVDTSIGEIITIVSSNEFTPGASVLLLQSQLKQPQLDFIKNYASTVFVHLENVNIEVYDNSISPFSWFSLKDAGIAARYYEGTQIVISTSSEESSDNLSFSSTEKAPYVFPSFSPDGWSANNSTLIFIKTGDEPFRIDNISEGGSPLKDLIGVWWETDWKGMGTKPLSFPIVIPPQQKAILQINHEAKNFVLSSLKINELNNLSQEKEKDVEFIKINPTKYVVFINATSPFFLSFNQPYNSDWNAFIDNKPLDMHFISNGFANAWYINKTGTYEVTIEFAPQKLVYLGSVISISTLFICTFYMSKEKIKKIYRKYRGKHVTSMGIIDV